MDILIRLFFSLASCLTAKAVKESTIVVTDLGEILGQRETFDFKIDVYSKTVDAFLGVPFAKPLTGKGRFRDPEEIEPWGTILNATAHGPGCRVAEDCLFLSIYTPYKKKEHKLHPVMVYIHGGSYSFGSGSSYNGYVLAQFGVVIVTINYRLYIPGFLSSDSPELPGNFGILDQIMALKWVKKRIRFFRGDPNNVLIFGNSAGGGSVGVHLLSPLSKGLFHRAVIQSGPVNAHWALYGKNESPRKYFDGVAEATKCNKGNRTTVEIVDCLRSLPYAKLMGRYGLPFESFALAGSDNKPTVDGRVIPKHYEDSILAGNINRVPIMLGVTSEEGAKIFWYFDNEKLNIEYPRADINISDGIDRTSFLNMIEHTVWKLLGYPKETVPIVQYEYTNWTAPDDPYTVRSQVFKFCTDIDMLVSTQVLARDLSSLNLDVYQYLFDYKIYNINITLGYVGQWLTQYSYHEIEIDLLFGIPFSHFKYNYFYTDPNFTTDDKDISYQIMKYWTNFAKYGNPNGDVKNFTGITKWETFTPSSESYLFMGNSGMETRHHLEAQKVAFWKDLMPGFKQKLKPVGPKRDSSDPPILWVFVSLTIGLSLVLLLLVSYIMKSKLLVLNLSHRRKESATKENNVKSDYRAVRT